jgi:ketosteroid isomerase-like protein
MQGEADDIVSVIMAKWSAGFQRLDAEALASLYSKSAFFFGSNTTLYRGRERGCGLLPRPTAMAFADCAIH